MREGPDITRIAALIGDPARAAILNALLSGKALTAGELAHEAGVTAATASGHLGQLRDAGLIVAHTQGRHRYHALRDAEVAQALEALAGLAASRGHLRTRTGPRDPDLRAARICYDHLAGARAVQVFDSLARRGFLIVGEEQLALSQDGATFFQTLGIDVAPLSDQRRPLCRICLDWSERRPHLAGALGAALLEQLLSEGWARRVEGTRRITFSASGERRLAEAFS